MPASVSALDERIVRNSGVVCTARRSSPVPRDSASEGRDALNVVSRCYHAEVVLEAVHHPRARQRVERAWLGTLHFVVDVEDVLAAQVGLDGDVVGGAL